MRILLLTTVFLLTLCLQARAQVEFSLSIHVRDSANVRAFNKLQRKISYKKTFSDTIQRRKELDQYILKLYDAGYLSASVDSMEKDSLSLHAFLHLGKTYEWIALQKGNVDEGILSESGFRERLYNKKPLYYRNLRKLEERILDYCENNGYPFASIRLDSMIIRDNQVSARLQLEKNTKIVIDSIVVKGTARISPMYLYNYLAFKPGNAYNETIIREISTRVRELPFLREIKPFEVGFADTKAKVYLYLENKKASQFDFIAGFLPDNNNPAKLQFTGDAHLKLQNSFGRGEIFELNWKSPLPQTQDLKINLVYPFIFKSPFGIDASFTLYKKDTTYLDIIRDIGIQYILTRGNYFKVFIVNKQSSLLSTKKYENTAATPDHLDVNSLSYGLGYKAEKLDYRYNPRKGYSAQVSGTIGTRNIRKNPAIKEEAYANIRLSTAVYTGNYQLDYFIPIRGKSVMNLGVKGAFLNSPDILTNELFRLGGLKTLRGFDEESILASSFTIGNIEYRYLLEQNSYMFMFYNQAYYENRSNGKYVSDHPYGFGAGITFETKLGIFSFTYALGKQFDNPIYLRSGKIHFGIISYF